MRITYMRERAPQNAVPYRPIFRGLKYICIHIQSMQFPCYYLYMVWRYKRHYNDKTLTLRKNYEYASERGVSELGNFRIFTLSKTAISFNILLVILKLYIRNIYFFRSQITSAYNYTINAVPCYYLWYGVIYIRHLRQ